MADELTKAELLEKMRSERARWEALLAEVGEGRLTEPGVAGEWSVKGIAAHLTVYERWTAGRLGGDVPPEPDAPPGVDMADLDQRNAWYHAYDCDRPLPDVLADSRRFHRLLRALVEAPGGGPARAVHHHGRGGAAPRSGARRGSELAAVAPHRRQRRRPLRRPQRGRPRVTG